MPFALTYGTLLILGLSQALFPRLPYRRLKAGWRQDLVWLVSGEHILPRVFAWLQFLPSEWLNARTPALVDLVRQPLWVQFGVGLVIADFTCYWVHRALHSIPPLWELHKAHHSSTELTAISNYRGGFFDVFLTDAVAFAPLHLLRLRDEAFVAIVTFVTLQGVINHVNLDIGSWFSRLGFCTPHFHRWHHARACRFRGGQNFGAALLVWDRLFGTAYAPAEPPPMLGFEGDDRFPASYLGRYLHPLPAVLAEIPRRLLQRRWIGVRKSAGPNSFLFPSRKR